MIRWLRARRDRAENESRERVLPTNHARAGIELHRMRYIPGFGIAGVVIAFLLDWYVLIRAWTGQTELPKRLVFLSPASQIA